MNNSIGIDFGTSNTLITVWDSIHQSGSPYIIPEYCRYFSQGLQKVPLIPSLIHYAADQRRWIGNQVLQNNLYSSNRTMRWMKRYISQRSPYKVNIDDQQITPARAARDFLSTLLAYTKTTYPHEIDSIGMSVPVESFEHYETWLTAVIHDAGFSTFRLIDEPSSAALGYGEQIRPGSVYLVFDFGGGTMHAAVVLMETENETPSSSRCRVLGKAGRDIGGSNLDLWLYEAILTRLSLNPDDPDARQTSNQLLVECEKAKEQLSISDTALIQTSQTSASTMVSRSQFEEILEKHELHFQINQTLRSAVNSARDRGYGEETIQSVLLIGGSSQIPSIRRVIEQFFGKDRVRSDHPMDAVALGAARLAGGMGFYDFIQHDYTIRFTDQETGEYAYKTIIKKGTPYPSIHPETILTIKGSYIGQEKLGIAIFEMGGQPVTNKENFELVFDPQGYARIMPLTSLEMDQRQLFWMNENSLLFINAAPAIEQIEPRFEISFYINQNKQLIISVYDIKMDKKILDQELVVKLS